MSAGNVDQELGWTKEEYKKNIISTHGDSTARGKVNQDCVAKRWQTLTLRSKI